MNVTLTLALFSHFSKFTLHIQTTNHIDAWIKAYLTSLYIILLFYQIDSQTNLILESDFTVS